MSSITSNQIQDQVRFLGKSLNQDLQNTSPVVFICILNGAFMFFSDLMKQIHVKSEIDFIRVKSYKAQTQQEIQIIKDIEINIKGKTVVLVDDLIDSGNTILKLIEHLQQYNPLEIKTVSLLKRYNSKFEPNYYAFHIHHNEWFYGYGLDLNGYHRNLLDILVLEK
jgi:hypoxanthine phosphoribosyltransferase